MDCSPAMSGCCTLEHIALGVACGACIEIVVAFGRSATEAPGPVPVERDVRVLSHNLPPGSVDALPGGLFGLDEVAAGVPVCIGTDHAGQARCAQRDSRVRPHP